MCVTVVARNRHIDMDFEKTLNSRGFTRWYKRNKKLAHTLALTAPAFAFTLFNVDAQLFEYLRNDTLMQASYAPSPVSGTGVGRTFFQTHGVILLHMLIMGFLTLVVSTFLRFTGRGDFVPLIAFVGGGAILYEVLGLFMDIYTKIMQFLNL